MRIELGNQVRDIITGFTGIAVARTSWLYGCDRIGIEPQELKDGKPLETGWFDEARVEVVSTEVSTRVGEPTPPGGPQRDPIARRDF